MNQGATEEICQRAGLYEEYRLSDDSNREEILNSALGYLGATERIINLCINYSDFGEYITDSPRSEVYDMIRVYIPYFLGEICKNEVGQVALETKRGVIPLVSLIKNRQPVDGYIRIYDMDEDGRVSEEIQLPYIYL